MKWLIGTLVVAVGMCCGALAESPGSIAGMGAVYWGGVPTNAPWTMAGTNGVMYSDAGCPVAGTWVYLAAGNYLIGPNAGGGFSVGIEAGKMYYIDVGVNWGYAVSASFDDVGPSVVWWSALIAGMVFIIGCAYTMRGWS